MPKLTFPGGALVGCSAGFMNVPRIKGSHNAILSGMPGGGAAAGAGEGRAHDELSAYEEAGAAARSGATSERCATSSRCGRSSAPISACRSAELDMWLNELFGFSLFGTLTHGKPDHATLKPLDGTPIVYPKPDGVLTFDKLSSVFISNTNHEEDQPIHLKLSDPRSRWAKNLPNFGEPARLYCPAGVYEIVYGDEVKKTDPRFVINAQNCVHCKTCDIKDPAQNITWCPGRRRRPELSQYVRRARLVMSGRICAQARLRGLRA